MAPETWSSIRNCKQYFTIESGKEIEDGENQNIWILAVVGNCVFCLAFFTTSYFSNSIETGFTIFRLCVMLAHLVASYVAMIRSCDARVVLWTTAFIAVNIYKLLQMAYKHRPTRYVKLILTKTRSTIK